MSEPEELGPGGERESPEERGPGGERENTANGPAPGEPDLARLREFLEFLKLRAEFGDAP